MIKKTKPFFFLFLITLIAFFVYILRLSKISSGFHGDEAELTLFSLKILSGKIKTIIGVGQHNHPIVSFLPQVLTMRLFGPNIFGARLASALVGVLTLPIFYIFVEENWNKRTAIIATILFAFSHWTIAINRLAINNNQTILYGILSLWSLLRAFKRNNIFFYSFAGAIAGFGIYLYAGARIFFIVISFALIYQFFKEIKNILKYARNLCFFAIFFLLIAFPQGSFFIQNRASFFSRFESIYLFSPGSEYAARYAHSEKNFWGAICSQTKKTFNLSKNWEDTSGQYGYKGRVFDPITLSVVIIGLLISLINIGQIKYFLLVLLLIFTLVFGEILIIDPFFFPRAVPALPAVFIFAGVGVDVFLKKLENLIPSRWKFLKPIFVPLLIFIIYQNLYVYFIRSEKEYFGDPNKYAATKITNYLNQMLSYQPIFLTSPNLHADFAPIRFLAPETKPVDIEYPLNFNPKPVKEKTVFVVYPNYYKKLEEIIHFNPKGKLIAEYNKKKEIQFWLYQIDPSLSL